MSEAQTVSEQDEHIAYYGHRTIRTADGSYGSMPFARCRCGWAGPSRTFTYQATADGLDHMASLNP